VTDDLLTDIETGENALIEVDPVLGKIIAKYRPIQVLPRANYFESLVRSIVGQQVSVAAARTIFNRLKKGTKLIPSTIDDMEIEELREFGLSRQKAGYIKDLAAHFVNDPALFENLSNLDDETIIEDLTDIRGIGPGR